MYSFPYARCSLPHSAALEVAGMLNDASLVLQAVVMCYGLLVPLIQHSIAAMPVVQVRTC